MEARKILDFANEQGYDGIQPLGKWLEFDVYEPIFDGNSCRRPNFIGPPLLILVRGETIRMSTAEEAFRQMEPAETE